MHKTELDTLAAWMRDTDARQFRFLMRGGGVMMAALIALFPLLDRFRGNPFEDGLSGPTVIARLVVPFVGATVLCLFFWSLVKVVTRERPVRSRVLELLCGLSTRDLIARVNSDGPLVGRLAVRILWARAVLRSDRMAEQFLRGENWSDAPEGQPWALASLSAATQEQGGKLPLLKLAAGAPALVMVAMWLLPLALAASQMPHWLAVIGGREAYRPTPSWYGVVAQISIYGGCGLAVIATICLQWKTTPRNERGKRPTTNELLGLWLNGDWRVWPELRLRSRPKKLKDPQLAALRERLPIGHQDPDIRWKDIWPLYRQCDKPPITDGPSVSLDW